MLRTSSPSRRPTAATRTRWTLIAVAGAGHGCPGAHDAEQTRLFGAPADLPATATAARFFGIHGALWDQ